MKNQGKRLRLKLSVRENQIAMLICDGLPNKEIASSCEISEETVKRHISNIFEKTGASNRTELVGFRLADLTEKLLDPLHAIQTACQSWTDLAKRYIADGCEDDAGRCARESAHIARRALIGLMELAAQPALAEVKS